MKFISSSIIQVDRELSDLDLFTIGFTRILKACSDYVIVSGYVSILLGRARVSEDIDIIVPKIEYPTFCKLLKALKQNGFYCLNAEKEKEIYDYIRNNFAVRFAKVNTAIPNIELKFAKNKVDEISLSKKITVKLNNAELVISHLEMQIAFKEVVLKSPKDMEDARHLRNVAKQHLNNGLIKKYEVMLNEFF